MSEGAALHAYLVTLQDPMEVACTRLVSITVDPTRDHRPFRAGLGARWTCLSDADRTTQRDLDLEDTSDPIHFPYLPSCDDEAQWWASGYTWRRIRPGYLLRLPDGMRDQLILSHGIGPARADRCWLGC